MGWHLYWAIPFLVGIAFSLADDNLREALQAVQKRQRDISTPAIYYSRPFIYGDGQPEDIGYGYQKTASPNAAGVFDNMPLPYADLGSHDLDTDQDQALEKFLMDYIEDADPRILSKINGNKRSVFREREPEGIQRLYEDDNEDNRPAVGSSFRERGKARLQAAHALVSNYGGLNQDRPRYLDDNEDDYLSVLNSIWEKYRGEEDPEDLSDADVEEILDYLSNRKDEEKRQYGGSYDTGYDFFNSPLNWKRTKVEPQHLSGHQQKRYPDTLFDERYPYKGQKRYPITKRSPAAYYNPMVTLSRRKKSEIKKTDPKVAAELNNIFETSTTNNNKTESTEAPKTSTQMNSVVASGQKEQTIDSASSKPVEVKKKSVNWSDYFGYDRKKKSPDWVVDQYLKSYGLEQNGSPPINEKMKNKEDIDSKMRAMEDIIVDEAIKYTGSHEGTKDSKEIQEVKDKVMAQLAAAYSLEKMRRALGEFKASIAAQKATAPASHSIPFPKVIEEAKQQKRVAIKKEMSPNDGKLEKKNPNHAHHRDEEESNQIKQRPIDIKQMAKMNEENSGECPVLQEIESRCKKVTRSNSGEIGNVIFLPLCTLHQICYLCGPEIGASSPHNCDTTFSDESQIICHGNPSCLYTSRLILSTMKRFRLYEDECDWRHNPCLANFLNAVTKR